jgi:hypothetical protein
MRLPKKRGKKEKRERKRKEKTKDDHKQRDGGVDNSVWTAVDI